MKLMNELLVLECEDMEKINDCVQKSAIAHAALAGFAQSLSHFDVNGVTGVAPRNAGNLQKCASCIAETFFMISRAAIIHEMKVCISPAVYPFGTAMDMKWRITGKPQSEPWGFALPKCGLVQTLHMIMCNSSSTICSTRRATKLTTCPSCPFGGVQGTTGVAWGCHGCSCRRPR